MIINRIRKLTASGDKNFNEILRHSIWALVILGLGTGIQFIFDFFMARTFGAQGTGVFYLSFSLIVTLSLFGHLGLDRTAVRLIPPMLAKKDYASANAVKNSSFRLVLVNTLVISVALFFLAPWLADNIFHDTSLTLYFRIFSLAIMPFSLRYLYGGILRALKRTKEALLVERVIIYVFGIIAIFTLGNLYGLRGMAYGFVISCFVSFSAGMFFTHKSMPKSSEVIKYRKKILLASGIPLLFVAVATQMNGQISVLILGSFGSNSDVGIYSTALKVSLVLSLILTAINTIAGTTISELHALGDKDKLEKIFSKTSALGFILALPLFLVMFLFPEIILSLFGSEFTAGSSTLMVLAVGQLINITVGPTLFILAMTGHEKVLAKAIGASLVINIIVGLIFIPTLKVFGAGLATALAMTISNIIMLILVRYYLGVWSLPFKYLRLWLHGTIKS